MKVIFSQKSIEELFLDFAKMQKKLGAPRTKSIKNQYNRLLAIRNFGEYLKLGLGKPHALIGNYHDCYGVHVDKKFRMIIRPVIEDGKIEMCEIVCIVELEDYHG